MTSGGLPGDEELLSVEEVAAYLGVGNVTVHRWCRDGSLPCLKIGRQWRIRRQVLEEFLEERERPTTLTGRLRSFLEVPDNVLAVSQNLELMHRLDAAYFQVGAARGGMLVKYHADGGSGSGAPDGGAPDEGDAEMDPAELSARLERHGLEARQLEGEGRLRFLPDRSEPGERVDQLAQLLAEPSAQGRPIWAAFNWDKRMDLEKAIDQQRRLTRLVEDSPLVVKTTVLEETLDEWPVGGERRAQLRHSSVILLSTEGLSLSRVSPLPEH